MRSMKPQFSVKTILLLTAAVAITCAGVLGYRHITYAAFTIFFQISYMLVFAAPLMARRICGVCTGMQENCRFQWYLHSPFPKQSPSGFCTSYSKPLAIRKSIGADFPDSFLIFRTTPNS